MKCSAIPCAVQELPARPAAAPGWPPFIITHPSSANVSIQPFIVIPPLSMSTGAKHPMEPMGINEDTQASTSRSATFIGVMSFVAITSLICVAVSSCFLLSWMQKKATRCRVDNWVEMAVRRRDVPAMFGATGSLQVGASGRFTQRHQQRVARTMRQVDECRTKGLFLGRFELLGRSECATGGASPDGAATILCVSA